jgi:hypothetical protein
MALRAGTKLGPYDVLAPLGSGGMGEMYRVRDPRLGHDVALKGTAEEIIRGLRRCRIDSGRHGRDRRRVRGPRVKGA